MKKVFAACLLSVFMLIGTLAHAQEEQKNIFNWDIYGKLYFDAFYSSASENEFTGTKGLGRTDAFKYNILNFSKIGFRLNYGKLTGVTEFGTSQEALIRLMYVQYEFDRGGKILFGQARTIAAYNFGQMSNNQDCLIDYGTLNDTRRPMVKYTYKGFNIALVSGNGLPIMGQDDSVKYLKDTAKNLNASNPAAGVLVFEWLPKVELAYDIKSEIFNGSVFGSYVPNILKSKNAEGSYKNYNINTFSIGFGGQFDIDDLFIHVTAYYGMNLRMTTNLYNTLLPAISTNGTDNKIHVQDVQSAGGAVGFGYRINEMFTPQIGAGFASSFGGPIAGNDDAWGAYINVIIRFNKWISLTPEVAFTDDMYDGRGNKQGNKVYAGAQIEVAF